MKFKRVSSGQYDGGSCTTTLRTPYHRLVAILGAPHVSDDADYPDDDYKTDVCWCVKSDTGAIVTVWNYKNGPNYNNGEGRVEDIASFSVYYTDAAFYEYLQCLILNNS